jgi:tripartite-type tricarboxylate transporter receptor subunit TctC
LAALGSGTPGDLKSVRGIMRPGPVLALAAVLGTALAVPDMARADTYPSRQIRLIVPFPAGGPLDIVARSLADKLSASLKQTIVAENRSGAGGNLGTEAVARAAPDGYTLLMALSSTLTVNPSLYKKLPFDAEKDLRPISIVTTSSQMLVVHPSVPVNTVHEFVAYAKREPVAYAHAGHGSPGHLVMEYFGLKAGFKGTHVPYRGNAPLVNDLIAGQIKFAFVATAGVINHVRGGRLKGLAISAARRSELAPDVPTVAESGYPGFQVETYFVFAAPAAVPEPVAALLEREVREALQSPDLKERFRTQDIGILGSTGAQAKMRIKADAELWAGIVKAANMQLD